MSIRLKKHISLWLFHKIAVPLHRFPYNRWQDAEFPVMLYWDDKQFND